MLIIAFYRSLQLCKKQGVLLNCVVRAMVSAPVRDSTTSESMDIDIVVTPTAKRGVGRPRLPTPERKRRRLERARAWNVQNPERKQATAVAYRARPGYLEGRRFEYATERRRLLDGGCVPRLGRPRLSDDVGTPALVLARHYCRSYREKRRRALQQELAVEGCVQLAMDQVE